jgi:hypothetical protein
MLLHLLLLDYFLDLLEQWVCKLFKWVVIILLNLIMIQVILVKIMNSLDPFLRMGASAGAGAIQSNASSSASTQSSKYGGKIYKEGGPDRR